MTCIFCNRSIEEHPTKEHIILSCLGGKTVTTTTICSICNQELNSKADVHLKNETLYIRYLLQLKNRNGSGTIELRGVDSDKGKINIDSKGNIIHQTKPFEIKDEVINGNQKTIKLSIYGGSDDEYLKNLKKTKQMIKGRYGEGALRSFEERIKDTEVTTNRFSQVMLNTHCGIVSYDCCRSAAKMLLIYWAYKTSNREVQQPGYDSIKSLINGDKDYSKVSILIPKNPIQKMINALETFLYVQSDSTGSVIGYFQLFGGLIYKVRIAEGCSLKDNAFKLSSFPFPSMNDEEYHGKIEIQTDEYDELFFKNLNQYRDLVHNFMPQFMLFLSLFSEKRKIPKVIDQLIHNFNKRNNLDEETSGVLRVLAQDLYEKLFLQKGLYMQLLDNPTVLKFAMDQIIEIYLANCGFRIPENFDRTLLKQFLHLTLKDFFNAYEPTISKYQDFV